MLIPIVIVIVVVFVLVGLYNTLISRKNQVENAFGSIDVMLKRRFDMIPNLVETVKQYMTFEGDTLKRITELRSRLSSEPNMPAQQRMGVENELTKLLSGLHVAVENYPELKSAESFAQLQRTWTDVEDQIASARRTYNAAVTSYNNAVEMFPTNLMAAWMRYLPMEVLAIDDPDRQNVSAKELFNN
ncbi:MAG: LemA family protein [Chitinophagales bacterium]